MELNGPDRSKGTLAKVASASRGFSENLEDIPVVRRELTTILPPPAPSDSPTGRLTRVDDESLRHQAVVDYHTLPIIKEEIWPDGIVRTWIASPFPLLDTRVDSPKSSDIVMAIHKMMDLDSIRSTQKTVTVNGLDKPRDDSYGLPLVIHSHGANYIQDGHHRLAKEYFTGKQHSEVRYVDLDND